MKTEHVLLLSIALSIPALAAETKSSGNSNAGGKSGDQVTSKSDVAQSRAANTEAMPSRPAKKNRVHQTFPPAAKRM